VGELLIPMRRPLWLAAAALLVAGCSASGHEAAGGTPDPRPFSGATHFSSDEARVLHRAEEAEVGACMERRGLTYRTATGGDARRDAADSPYGLLRPGWAGSDGYGMTARVLAGPPPDPNEAHLAGLSDRERSRWRTALLGDEGDREEITVPGGPTLAYSPDSCVHIARTEVYGDGWTRLEFSLQHAGNEVIERTYRSPGFRGAQAEWARCMREEGYAYRTLEDPRDRIQRMLDAARGDPGRLRAAGRAELASARQDLDCQLGVDLHRRVAEAQRTAEEPVRRRWAADLERFAGMREAAVGRARHMTESGSPSAPGRS
jgi:hypothetical protein